MYSYYDGYGICWQITHRLVSQAIKLVTPYTLSTIPWQFIGRYYLADTKITLVISKWNIVLLELFEIFSTWKDLSFVCIYKTGLRNHNPSPFVLDSNTAWVFYVLWKIDMVYLTQILMSEDVFAVLENRYR